MQIHGSKISCALIGLSMCLVLAGLTWHEHNKRLLRLIADTRAATLPFDYKRNVLLEEFLKIIPAFERQEMQFHLVEFKKLPGFAHIQNDNFEAAEVFYEWHTQGVENGYPRGTRDVVVYRNGRLFQSIDLNGDVDVNRCGFVNEHLVLYSASGSCVTIDVGTKLQVRPPGDFVGIPVARY